MRGSGVDEDTNQNIYDNEKPRFAKEGFEKIHASYPSLWRLKLSI
jgi:hypothetical protein